MIDEILENIDINNWEQGNKDIMKYIINNESILLKIEDIYIIILNGDILAIGTKNSGEWKNIRDNIKDKLGYSYDIYIPQNDACLIGLAYNILNYKNLDEIYTKDNDLDSVDKKLQEKEFTGFISISNNTISGNHYIMYYNGTRYNLTYKNGQFITGDQSNEMSNSYVGLYKLNKITVNYSIDIDQVTNELNSNNRVNNSQNDNKHKDKDNGVVYEDTLDEDALDEEQNEEDGNVYEDTLDEDTLDEDTLDEEQNEEDENVYEESIQQINRKVDLLINKVEDVEERLSKIRTNKDYKKHNGTKTTRSDYEDIISQTQLKLRYNMSTKSLRESELDSKQEIKNIINGISFNVQSTVDDHNIELNNEVYVEFVKSTNIYNFLNWMYNDMYVSLMEQKTPNLPGLLLTLTNMEGVKFNASIKVDEEIKSNSYDSIIYKSDGEPTGIIKEFSGEVTFEDINSIIDDIRPISEDVSNTINILVVSTGTYASDIRTKIDEKVYNGSFFRREDRDGFIKTDGGGEINVCLFERNMDGKFIMTYPRA